MKLITKYDKQVVGFNIIPITKLTNGQKPSKNYNKIIKLNKVTIPKSMWQP